MNYSFFFFIHTHSDLMLHELMLDITKWY